MVSVNIKKKKHDFVSIYGVYTQVLCFSECRATIDLVVEYAFNQDYKPYHSRQTKASS